MLSKTLDLMENLFTDRATTSCRFRKFRGITSKSCRSNANCLEMSLSLADAELFNMLIGKNRSIGRVKSLFAVSVP